MDECNSCDWGWCTCSPNLLQYWGVEFKKLLDVCGFRGWELTFAAKFVGPSHYGKVSTCFHPISRHGNTVKHGETRWNTVKYISVEVSLGVRGVFPWLFLSRSEHRFDLLRCPHRLSAANLLCLKNLPPDHVPCESEHVPACKHCVLSNTIMTGMLKMQLSHWFQGTMISLTSDGCVWK